MVQARRVSRDDNDDDDDRHIEDSDIKRPKLQLHGRDTERHSRNTDKETQRAKKYDPDDEERSARDIDREAQMEVKERDPRKTLMPRVLHRSTMETSFGMDAADSQVQCMRAMFISDCRSCFGFSIVINREFCLVVLFRLVSTRTFSDAV